ncbi:SDR family oxidoreductase [Brucella pituitosa]|uniref:SDR family oxidoreductase n=1 Tax=Brucella pituitosa TaxID=571256 RepID=UPI001C264E0F
MIVWTLQNRWTWRDRGIRINAVSPGPVETPILADFVKTLGARVEEDMRVMDRPGRPSDIAPVVAFLLSDGSRWIRGVNIPADGGMNSYPVPQAQPLT